MAHPDGAAIADGAAAAAGLVGLEPELLVASLIFLDHVAAVRTASTCKPLRSVLLGTGYFDAAYLWRRLFHRRWLFGLRRRHHQRLLAALANADAPATVVAAPGADFLAFRARHEQARRMEEGKAGQFRVQTVRPPAATFTATLMESERCDGNEGNDGGEGEEEGPVAYVGTQLGVVMKMGYGEAGDGTAFRSLWQSPAPDTPSPIQVLARDGNVLACGRGGAVVLLHADTGRPVQLEGQEGSGGAGRGDAVIDTGLELVTSLLWLEGGRLLAVASHRSGQVKLFCPRTGLLCQDIPPGVPEPPGPPHPGILALLKREEVDDDRRPHFLALRLREARFFVKNTAAETSGAGGFRSYSEHGRAFAGPDGSFSCAAFAPALGGFPHDEELGVYRVFLGTLSSGVKTVSFAVHPRIRLAQLLQADLISPLRPVNNTAGVFTLQVRSVNVPKPLGAEPGTAKALLVAVGSMYSVEVLSLHAVGAPDGADEPAIACCPLITQETYLPITNLCMVDEEKVVAAAAHCTHVFAIPRSPAPYPVSCDPEPVRAQFAQGAAGPLYTLHGGSVTLTSGRVLGVGLGAAEVVLVYDEKLRLYDFSP